MRENINTESRKQTKNCREKNIKYENKESIILINHLSYISYLRTFTNHKYVYTESLTHQVIRTIYSMRTSTISQYHK